MTAFNRQVGGDHYKSLKIPLTLYVEANNLGYLPGNIIKYATRYAIERDLEDLDKIIQYTEMAKELHGKTPVSIIAEKEGVGRTEQSNPP